MTDLRKAAEMALEALQNYIYMPPKKLSDAITALRQALEQPSDIEAAVKKENEACAKVCEVEASVIVTNASEQYQEGRAMGATVCATAIRARMK